MKKFVFISALALLALTLISSTKLANNFYSSVELQVFGPRTGYDERELAGKIDIKKFFATFKMNRLPVEESISDFIIDTSINKVCLTDPYALPPEQLSLNGLPQSNDSIWYVTFIIDDTKHYYAVPLRADYYIQAGCREPKAVLSARSCTAFGTSKSRVCFRWSDQGDLSN